MFYYMTLHSYDEMIAAFPTTCPRKNDKHLSVVQSTQWQGRCRCLLCYSRYVLAIAHLFGNARAQLCIILSLSVLRHGLSTGNKGIKLLGQEPARWGDLPGQVLEAVTGFAPGHSNSTQHFSIEVDGC